MAFVEPAHQSAEVLVALTWRCNLSCSYCFVRGNGLMTDGADMTAEMAARVVDALDKGLDDVATICIHFYGGEPFINVPALQAMVERADEKRPGRFSFAVTTNGTLLSEEITRLLATGKFKVVLSIDGPADIHNECRRTVSDAPTHFTVMRFLEEIRRGTSCHVCGSAVVRSGWGLLGATEYLRTLPVDAIKAQMVRLPATSPYALPETEKQVYMEDLETIGRRVIEDLEAGQLPRDNRFSSRVLQLLKDDKRRNFCGAGRTTFGITPAGLVLPCILIEADGDNILGHIDDAPGLWRQAGYNWQEKPLRQDCESCRFLHLCGGGCPAMAPVCGEEECEVVRKNCEVAIAIFEHFRHKSEALLALAGII